jgi:hypothetical protein
MIIAASDYGPFAPVVGYAATIIAAGTALAVTWRGALEKWKPPEEDLPNAAQKLVLLICGVQMVIVWMLAAPDTSSRLLMAAGVSAIVCFVVFLSYSAMIGKYTFIKRIAVSAAETREVRLLGGRKLLPGASAIMKKKGIGSVQELLEGAAYDVDKLWSRDDRAWVKTPLIALFVLILVSGTLALTAAGFATQVILTGKSAASVIHTKDAPGLKDSTNGPNKTGASPIPSLVAPAQAPAAPEMLLAIVEVHRGPLPGEGWRASKDFSISCPPGTKRLRWVVVETNCQKATFSVAKDVAGWDPTELENLRSGHISAPFSQNGLYVGGVSGAPADFTLVVHGE